MLYSLCMLGEAVRILIINWYFVEGYKKKPKYRDVCMLRRRVNKYEELSQLNTKIVRIGLESAKVTSHERDGVSNYRKHYRLLTRLCRMTSMKNQTSALFLLWDRNHGVTGGAFYKRNAGNVVCHGEQNYYKIKQFDCYAGNNSKVLFPHVQLSTKH